MNRPLSRLALALAATAGFAGMAQAADPESCAAVRMSDPGWSDITSTNGFAGVVLDGLGYSQNVSTLSVPITYQAIANNEIDVFLGNWMPAHQAFREEAQANNSLEQLAENLGGVRFTVAVPSYVSEAGVTDVSDLAEHAQEFNSRLYGIDAGSPANENLQAMIDSGDFGLDGWEVVASSEQGMLAQVSRAERREQWIAFLAWEPHPMNANFDITYLSGADDYFGPDFGRADINTVARAGYAEDCPNAGKLFEQMTFTVEMENALMDRLADGETAEAAATAYLTENPDVLEPWLDGVTTLSGKPGLDAVRAHLGL
ncbi:choline ABC transporter substrate-binding protein [Aureimonas mangrovi]|uniref:choline ABC transporter substrate-binding protein n=1 Tax=Aureimonas mangrovi TaxID=2758041 RepID=UPI00163DD6E5|nr:choline ABC transporter substrate-binding protein [Aureimonas mangrovi]